MASIQFSVEFEIVLCVKHFQLEWTLECIHMLLLRFLDLPLQVKEVNR